jgi:hypothetical protein
VFPSQLDFEFPVNFSDGTSVGGWIRVSMLQDGTARFSGHLHDSGGLSYAASIGCAVIDSKNRAYTFEGTGHIWGTDLPGSRDLDWDVQVPSHTILRDSWSDLFDCGGTRRGYQVDVQTMPPGGLIAGEGQVAAHKAAPGVALTFIALVTE